MIVHIQVKAKITRIDEQVSNTLARYMQSVHFSEKR